jgi:ribosomal protein L44E
MDDLQFYLVNDYCPRCNSVTQHDAFEVDNKQHKDEAQVEQVCEKCQGLEL